MLKLSSKISPTRKVIAAFAGALILALLLGPRPSLPLPIAAPPPEVPSSLEEIQRMVLEPVHEQNAPLRDHRCASRLRWQGQPGAKTQFVIIFVHGFSACPIELFPVLDIVSDNLGANLLAIRLRGHGRTDDGMSQATATQWLEDLQQARQIAKAMGQETLIVGMSTGATLAVLSLLEDPSDLSGLALLSPNFGVVNNQVSLLTWPWGVPLASLITGGSYHSWEPETPERAKLWTTRYSLDVVAEMQKLVEVTAARSFANVRIPTLFVRAGEDSIVRIDRMEQAYARWGSKKKKFVELVGSTRHELAGATIAPELSPRLAELVTDFFKNAWTDDEENP